MIKLRHFAQKIGIDEKTVLKAVKKELKLSPDDVHFPLKESHCAALKKLFNIPDDDTPTSTEIELSIPKKSVTKESTSRINLTPLKTKRDLPSKLQIKFRELNFSIWFNPDISDTLENLDMRLSKRLGIVLHHMAAYGRTTCVKGCSDSANKGWLRTPLGGGSSGMHYYLWWTKQGNPPVKHLELTTNDIVIKAVRHHDDHSPLSAGSMDDYLNYRQPELSDVDLISQPWTHNQLQFVNATDPLRLIIGRPGAGKTMALWKAIEARANEKVLYLTWSKALTENAQKHFKAFAPENIEIVTLDFLSFVSEICQYDVKRRTLKDSLQNFEGVVSGLNNQELGLWAKFKHLLYGEIRAYILGSVAPLKEPTLNDGTFSSINEHNYLSLRKKKLGTNPAEQAFKLYQLLSKKEKIEHLFPELTGAAKAIANLRDNKLPSGFAKFNKIVIDELQDLTLLELNVIIELCRCIHNKTGVAPQLLAAGDEGQTVRPTGFEWGPTKDLLASRFTTPAEYALEENLRCPYQIGEVIKRTSEKYTTLQKELRPSKQNRNEGGQHTNANLFHVPIADRSEAISLLQNLNELDNVIVMSPAHEIPKWIPAKYKNMILTPAMAKGLEYEAVCVIDGGKALSWLETSVDYKHPKAMEEQSIRTVIDQFRVAVSRATETLAIIDVEATDTQLTRSSEILDSHSTFEPSDLISYFTNNHISTEEQVVSRINTSKALINENPAQAWYKATQAVDLLGNPSMPNSVTDESIREEAKTNLLATAAQILTGKLLEEMKLSTFYNTYENVLKEPKFSIASEFFKAATLWYPNSANGLFNILSSYLAVKSKGFTFLEGALSSIAQVLRKQLNESAGNPNFTAFYGDEVEDWLKATGFMGDEVNEAMNLRRKAFDIIINDVDLKKLNDFDKTVIIDRAEYVLKAIEPKDPERTGKILELQGEFTKAAKVFEKAGFITDSLRNFRLAGNWRKALKITKTEYSTGKINLSKLEIDDLQWLNEIEQLILSQPKGQQNRLTNAEKSNLNKLLKKTTG